MLKFFQAIWRFLFGKKNPVLASTDTVAAPNNSANITLTLQNPGTKPANQPELYIGESNQLNFLFRNSLGIPNVNPGDIFAISIPDNLITSANANQLMGNSWKVNQLTHQNNVYTFELTPLKQLDFSGVITISFDKLNSQIASNGDVTSHFMIDNAPISGPGVKLFVSEPPSNKLKPLTEYIIPSSPFINQEQQMVARGTVYTSPVGTGDAHGELQPPVANQIHLNLKFNGSQLVNKPWNKTPQFMFSFSYGNDGNDLTNAIKSGEPNYNPLTTAWKITARIANNQSSQWKIQALNNNSTTPVWIVEPTANNPHLFTNTYPDLDIIFEHAISAVAPYNASVYIQWADIPGYNPGRFVLDLPKQLPDPKVVSFTSPDTNFSPEQAVSLSWQTFGTSQVVMSWVDINDTSTGELELPAFPRDSVPALVYAGSNKQTAGYAIPPFQASETSYTCTLAIPGDPQSGRQLTFKLGPDTAPVIEQFSADITISGDIITLKVSWLVKSDNVNLYCELPGVSGPLPLQGAGGAPYSHSIQIDDDNPLPSELQLCVKGFYPEVTAVASLQYKTVQTIPNATILSMSSDSSQVFFITGTNLLYYVDTMADLDKFTALDQYISIGEDDSATLGMYVNPAGKQAFVINVAKPKDSPEVLYYFDTDNLPKIATKTIDMAGSYISPLLPLGSDPLFTEDGSRVYFSGVKDGLPVTMSYFDPANPPTVLPQQIKFPAGITGTQFAIYLYSIPTKNKAFTYAMDTNTSSETAPSFFFDIEEPPAALANSATYEFAVLGIYYTPDGETAFVFKSNDSNNELQVAYYPSESPPASLSNVVPNSSGSTAIRLNPDNGDLYTVSDKVNIYSWKDPSQPASKTVAIPGQNVDVVYTKLTMNNSLLLMTDTTNGHLCYFNVNNPPQTIGLADVGENPFSFYASKHGLRVFVNNGLLANSSSISVLQAYYK